MQKKPMKNIQMIYFVLDFIVQSLSQYSILPLEDMTSFSCYVESLFSFLLKIVYFPKLILLHPFSQSAEFLTLPASHQPLPHCCSHVLFFYGGL